jgi:hypothetical protein
MQKSTVMSAESSLMKELILLQRSRSLRDPSTSPSWNSPIIGSLMKRLEKEGATQKNDFRGVRSLGGELRKELRRGFVTSPLSQSDTLIKIQVDFEQVRRMTQPRRRKEVEVEAKALQIFIQVKEIEI